jgi:hypothetical protein
LRRVVWWKSTDVSEVLAASFIRAMMEAAGSSETSVNFYLTTRRKNPEDSHLYVKIDYFFQMLKDCTHRQLGYFTSLVFSLRNERK